METAPIKLLLIEDNPSDVMLIQKLLGKKGCLIYDVHVANSLSSGLNHIKNTDFHIVFLDLNLPDSKNIDTYLILRDQAPELPVIVLTGMENQELANLALREGAQDCFLKGRMDIALLERSICYSLERKKVELALRDVNENLEEKVKQRTEKLKETVAKLEVEITERKKAEEKLKAIHERLREQVT